MSVLWHIASITRAELGPILNKSLDAQIKTKFSLNPKFSLV